MAKLVCQAGPNAGHEYKLSKDKSLFGRQKVCDVQIMDSMASREHFIIRKDGDLYTLVDLQSRNGTYLNNRKVNERHLEFGDILRVGAVEYLFLKEEGDVDLKDLLEKKYSILEKVGEGGMGIVYKAVQKSMERTVALKILAPKYATRPRFVEQFIREARAVGAMNHPNVIQIHDVASENGVHYFSMEFIDGPTAMQMLSSQGPLPAPVALEIVRQTAKALTYAHEHRIIHRDIKPDNIMVTSNNVVKLADLGISKSFDEAESENASPRIVGTPHYLAPEVGMGERIDHRVDIYSLGVALYQLLSGRTPFTGSKATDVVKAHIQADAPILSTITTGVSEEISNFVHCMMAKDRDQRPQSAEEVSLRLEELLADKASGSQETVMLRRMVASTASAAPEGKLPKNPSGAVTSQHDDIRESGGHTEVGSGTDLQRLLVPLIAAGILVLGLSLLILVVIRVLNEDSGSPSADPPQPQVEQEESREVHEVAPEVEDLVVEPSPTEIASADHIQRLNSLSERLSAASDAAELAAVLEELRLLRRESSHEAVLTRVARMEETVRTRMSHALMSEERQRFSALESDVNALTERSDFTAALQLVRSFEHEHDEQLQERKQRLLERIQNDEQRYLANLERRIQRLISRGDLNDLRALRDEIPRPLLEHPLVASLSEGIRDLESAQLERERSIRGEASQLLLSMRFDELSRFIQRYQEGGHSQDFHNELQALHSLGLSMPQALEELDQQIRSRRPGPRYRGTLRGISEPSLVGANASGIQLSMGRGGGQATVPWREIEAETILELVSLGFENSDNDEAAQNSLNAFRAWIQATESLR